MTKCKVTLTTEERDVLGGPSRRRTVWDEGLNHP